MLSQLFAQTAVDCAPRIKLSKDSILRTSLMLHQRKILNNKEPSKTMLSPNYILKCNIVSHALFTQELSKLDQ